MQPLKVLSEEPLAKGEDVVRLFFRIALTVCINARNRGRRIALHGCCIEACEARSDDV